MTIQPDSRQSFPLVPEAGAGRVLVAEDPFVSSFLRTMLQRCGYEVITADPVVASGLLNDGSMKARLVITNCPEAFLERADSLPMLYIAANPDPAVERQFSTCRVLRKPFRNSDLLEAVADLSHAVLP